MSSKKLSIIMMLFILITAPSLHAGNGGDGGHSPGGAGNGGNGLKVVVKEDVEAQALLVMARMVRNYEIY